MKVLTCRQNRRSQRRSTGFQLPLHCLQVLGWFTIISSALINLCILIPCQLRTLRIVMETSFLFFFTVHCISHIVAMVLDPAENQLRVKSASNLPEFDRNVHAHVIENGRCHLCNIQASSKRTKHCGICNKCVHRFDHHCNWLNQCVGGRNYMAFFISVISGVMVAVLSTISCIIDCVFIMIHPEFTDPDFNNYIGFEVINCWQDTKVCSATAILVIFITIYGIISFTIACLLLHLCIFHVYISVLGMSTYEFIVRDSEPSRNTEESRPIDSSLHYKSDRKSNLTKWLLKRFSYKKKKFHQKYQINTITSSVNTNTHVDLASSQEVTDVVKKSILEGGSNVARIMNMLINRAGKNNSLLAKNKVYPDDADLEIKKNGNLISNLPTNPDGVT